MESLVGGCSEFVVVVGVDLEEMYWAMRSESSRKSISSSYEPLIVPVVGSQLQSFNLSTAEGVKHCFAMSP